MSPENDTHQHDDEARISIETLADVLESTADDFDRTWQEIALEVRDALRSAGFEITKPVESAGQPDRATLYGVTKGLPGLTENLAERFGRVTVGGDGATGTPASAPNWMDRLLQAAPPPPPVLDDQAVLAAALDVIGRRTDIVAVKLPEPTAPDFTGVEWSDKAAGWDVFAYGATEHRGKVQVRIPEFVAPTDACNAAAALLAAAAAAAEGDAK